MDEELIEAMNDAVDHYREASGADKAQTIADMREWLNSWELSDDD